MSYDAKTERLIAIKKLSGKAQTSNDKGLSNEALPSGITATSTTIFGEPITTSPSSTSLYTITGKVEYLRFPTTFIAGSDTSDGRHGFEMKLPADYEVSSSNSKKGTFPFLNNQVINIVSGSLQLIPTSFATPYEVKPYYGGTTAKNSGTQIPLLDARDWYLDYFNGIFFQQDPPGAGDHSNNPDYIEAYLYIGEMLDTKISSITGSSGPITALNNRAENRVTTIGSVTTELDGEANLTFDGSQLTVVGKISAGEAVATGALLDITGSGDELLIHVRDSGNSTGLFGITGRSFSPASNAEKIFATVEFSSSVNVSASAFYGDGSKLTGINAGIAYSRTAVTTTITASTSDTLLGVSASAALEIRLPSAGSYTAGQYFTIKDEGGNSNTNNITILASGAETIDGSVSVTLESPYSAINIYSDGTSKFFIY